MELSFSSRFVGGAWVEMYLQEHRTVRAISINQASTVQPAQPPRATRAMRQQQRAALSLLSFLLSSCLHGYAFSPRVTFTRRPERKARRPITVSAAGDDQVHHPRWYHSYDTHRLYSDLEAAKVALTEQKKANPNAGRKAGAPQTGNVITMYSKRNGFRINDGPFRSLKDPANGQFIKEIKEGVYPVYDLRIDTGGNSNVSPEDESDEDNRVQGYTEIDSPAVDWQMSRREKFLLSLFLISSICIDVRIVAVFGTVGWICGFFDTSRRSPMRKLRRRAAAPLLLITGGIVEAWQNRPGAGRPLGGGNYDGEPIGDLGWLF